MGRNKKLDPFSIKPQLERQRIWRGIVAYGAGTDMPELHHTLPATPDLSGASLVQETVIRNREYYHWQSYLHTVLRTVQCITSPTHMRTAIESMLIAYEAPTYEDTPDASAYHARTSEPVLVVQPGYQTYEPGRKYDPRTRMALYHKGTGKMMFAGTKTECEHWVNGHRDKHQLRRLIRIEVKVA